MAKRVKVTKKELKQPDRFRQIAAEAILWMQKNYRRIVATALGIVLIIAVSFIYLHLKQQKVLQANIEFKKIISTYESNQTTENSIDTLKKLESLRNSYSDTPIAHLSLYYSGVISFDMGKYEQSIGFFKDYLSSDVPDEMLKNSALLSIGLGYFNLKKWNEAIEYLSKVNAPGTSFNTQARLHIGLAYEKLGEYEKASNIYQDTLGLL